MRLGKGRFPRLMGCDHLGGHLWMLYRELEYFDSYGHRWVIPAGFVTNGANIPWYLQWLQPRNGATDDPACVHDWAYGQDRLNRYLCDWVYLDACLSVGIPVWRSWGMFIGLRIGGGLCRWWGRRKRLKASQQVAV